MSVLLPKRPVVTSERSSDRVKGSTRSPRTPLLTSSRRYVLAIVIIVTFIGLVHIAQFREISVFDEFQHIDYAQRVSQFDFPALGSFIEEPALREDACRGHQFIPELPPCDAAVLDPATFPGGGYDTSAAHPPGYFMLAGAGGRTIAALGGVDSFVTGARLISTLLLVLGSVGVWWLIGLFAVKDVVRFGIALVPATIPSVVHAGATVTPDATAILIGAMVPAIVIAHLRGNLPTWTVVAASFALGLTKINNLLILGVVAVMLIGLLIGGQINRRSALREAALITLPAIFAFAAWSALVIARDVSPPGGLPTELIFRVTNLPGDNVWRSVDALFPPAGFTFGDRFSTVPYATWATVVAWVLVGSSFLALASSDRLVRWIGGGAMMVAIASGPILVIFNYVSSSSYFDLPQRYGLVFIPTLLVGLATTLRGKWGSTVGLAIPIIGIAAFLWAFLPAR